MRILLDPVTRGQYHDLTGPELLSWPDVMRLLAAEIGEPVTFQTTSETELISRLTGTGASPRQAELLIARERALQPAKTSASPARSSASPATSPGPSANSCTTSGQPSPEARFTGHQADENPRPRR